MTAIDKIDLVLRETTVQIQFNDLANKYVEILRTPELEQILHKLKRDGFVTFGESTFEQQAPDGYRLSVRLVERNDALSLRDLMVSRTFDGQLFSEAGGYKEQARGEKIVNEKIELENEIKKRNDKRLVLWTKWVAAGPIGLVVWEVIKTFWIERCH